MIAQNEVNVQADYQIKLIISQTNISIVQGRLLVQINIMLPV